MQRGGCARAWFLIGVALCGGGVPGVYAASTDTSPQAEVGVLILAHGGSAQWNRLVQQTVADAHLPYPTQITFGMAMHHEEVQAIQRAVRALETRRVRRIVAIPLLVSSASEVMRQFEYVLGVRGHGPWETHAKPVAHRIPVTMASPLDDDPAVAEVLLDRVKALSRAPREESVVLVAHGPNEEADNARWLETMQRIAKQLEDAGHFRAVVPVTMRDDAPEAIREAATRQMREVVHAQSTQGPTLVVPLLLARGGVETKIPQRLHGLQYQFSGEGLLPHPKITQWLMRQAMAAVERIS